MEKLSKFLTNEKNEKNDKNDKNTPIEIPQIIFDYFTRLYPFSLLSPSSSSLLLSLFSRVSFFPKSLKFHPLFINNNNNNNNLINSNINDNNYFGEFITMKEIKKLSKNKAEIIFKINNLNNNINNNNNENNNLNNNKEEEEKREIKVEVMTGDKKINKNEKEIKENKERREEEGEENGEFKTTPFIEKIIAEMMFDHSLLFDLCLVLFSLFFFILFYYFI